MGRKEVYTILEIDPNYSVYSNLRSRTKKEGEDDEVEG